ncbi:MAG: YvcK family protein [SAR202 cluster bacterium]|nr:YvcK family protein [SAR202 cluster bacterium]
MGRLLRITGQVIPVSLERSDLCAELASGEVILGESKIDTRRQRLPAIRRMFLDPPVRTNPGAVRAIMDADLVVLGPGDLYTSIIPNLLVDGIAQAIAASRATRVYVSNLMFKVGETDGYAASDFVRAITEYCGGSHLDWALINIRPVPDKVKEAYAKEGSGPVTPDLDMVRRHVPAVFASSVANGRLPFKHDPDRVAEAVLCIARLGRTMPRFEESPRRLAAAGSRHRPAKQLAAAVDYKLQQA